MKTKCLPCFQRVILLSFLSLLMFPGLIGQDLKQTMTSRLDVVDDKDWQTIDSDTYLFGDEVLHDNPNSIRMFPDGFYRFRFRFTYFGDKNNTVTAKNYLSKRYSLQVPSSEENNYRVTAVSPSADSVSIYVVALGQASTVDTFRIQLIDERGNRLSEVIYPFEIMEDDPDATTFAALPMIIQDMTPLYVTMVDVNNPKNRIERQLLPNMPDTINIDAKDAYKMMLEIEQTIYIENKSYVLVADHENDYGYTVSYEWLGQGLREKPIDKNGMQQYITAVPGKTNPSYPTLDLEAIAAKDLMRSGLVRQNARIKPQYSFVTPNTKLQKVYSVDYIKTHPEAVRKRTRTDDQDALLKATPQAQERYLKVQDRSLLYKVDPAKIKTEPAKTTTEPVQIQKQRYQISKQPATTRIERTDQIRARPSTTRPTRTNPTVTRPAPPQRVTVVPDKPSPYYTLSIEVERETDMLSYRTYLLTFRLVE